MKFITEDFLLHSKAAKELYHNHAKKMPIFDYHCHIPVKEIADDITFENLTQVWLNHDHYKWRVMRSNGADEKYCTGNASDYEKYEEWARTVPYLLRNPQYHWVHLELARYFNIDDRLLNSSNSKYIYDKASELLGSKEFSARNLIRKMNVKIVCTTDDPTDSLEYHKKIKNDGFEVKVLPTFRPQAGLDIESLKYFNSWVDKLGEVSNINIEDYNSYIDVLKKRQDFFHEAGCRVSDISMDKVYAEDYTENEIKRIFKKIRNENELTKDEANKFKSAMLIEFAKMNHAKGWVFQFRYGVIRNNNTRFYNAVGPNTGFDSMCDIEVAKPLAKFMDKLDSINKLPKTVIYNLNPKDNELVASMIGNFQDGIIPAKIQFGPGWWFSDQKEGIINQINALSNSGLLSRFIGMNTDSRSFLSYTRHEYFRRILCNLLGDDIVNGEIPGDFELPGQMVENISFNNAKKYFDIELD